MAALVSQELDGADTAGRSVSILFERDRDDFMAIVATKGRTRRLRSLDCDELAASAALVAAIALTSEAPAAESAPRLDERDAADHERDAPSAPAPQVTTTERRDDARRDAPARRALPPMHPLDESERDFRLALAFGGHVSAGLTPQVGGGPSLGVELRGLFWSAGAEARYTTRPEEEVELGEHTYALETHVFTGGVVPCLRLPIASGWSLDACGVLHAGAIFARVRDLDHETPGALPVVDLGGRARIEALIAGPVGVRANIEGLGHATPARFVVVDHGQTLGAWTSPEGAVVGTVEIVIVAP